MMIRCRDTKVVCVFCRLYLVPNQVHTRSEWNSPLASTTSSSSSDIMYKFKSFQLNRAKGSITQASLYKRYTKNGRFREINKNQYDFPHIGKTLEKTTNTYTAYMRSLYVLLKRVLSFSSILNKMEMFHILTLRNITSDILLIKNP